MSPLRELGVQITLCVLTVGIGYAIFGPQVRYQLWQFRLRSLAVTVTLACVLFALIRLVGFERFVVGAFLTAVLVALVTFICEVWRFLTN